MAHCPKTKGDQENLAYYNIMIFKSEITMVKHSHGITLCLGR